MRVMTLNLWNYNPPWERRREAIVQVVEEAQPDVLALQESRHDRRFDGGLGQAEQIAGAIGYAVTSAVAQVYIPFSGADEGLAILSRVPPVTTDLLPLTLHPHLRDDENHRICLAAAFDAGGNRVIVACTHFSLSAAARMSNARETAGFLEGLAGIDPVVLMGDLNAEPQSSEIRFLVEEAGFLDAWESARGDDPGFTYASFDPVRRIDYILTKNLASAPESVHLAGSTQIGGVFPSDHLGIVADLREP